METTLDNNIDSYKEHKSLMEQLEESWATETEYYLSLKKQKEALCRILKDDMQDAVTARDDRKYDKIKAVL